MYLALQGNIGLGKAIEYFTSHQISVALPLNDTQKYDLIADFNGRLQRISVKTSRNCTQYGTYVIQLRNCGGSSGKGIVRPFDKTSCDYIFALTGDDKLYLIPSERIEAVNSITVGKKYTEFQVETKKFSDFSEEIKEG